MAESDLPDEELFTLILDLDARGFSEEDFRASAADALRRRLRQKVGLPEAVTALLERWLSASWTPREPGRGVEPTEPPATPPSVLWGDRGGLLIPHGVYSVLHTLSYGYLMRDPPAADRWLAALEAHVERPETQGTWEAMASHLRYLSLCAPNDAARFLYRLFERFPGMLASRPGAVLVGCAGRHAPDADVWTWMDRIRASNWRDGKQAYGELVALRAHYFPADGRAREEVEFLLRPDHRGDTAFLSERIGLALAGVRLWQDPEARRLATDILVGLMPGATERLARAVLSVFRGTNGLDADDGTHRLLTAVVENLPILVWLDEGWLFEHLERLLPHEAWGVGRICRELVRLRGEEMGSLSSGWAEHAAHLTSIAITL